MKILETKSKNLQEKLKNLPKTPGIYKYFDKNRTIIYVGKAKNLQNRVKSYFNNYSRLDNQKQSLVQDIWDMEIQEVDTEIEALILEVNAIKKYLPKYNIMLRDDKSYIYVRFERLRKSNQHLPTKYSVYQDFPRIFIIRNKKDDGAEYFGPYPESRPIKYLLRNLRKALPYRTSKDLIYEQDGKIVSSAKKIPLEVHLGLTGGAEFGKETKKEYAKRFLQIKKFFEGKKSEVLTSLQKKIKNLSDEQRYEEAAIIRDNFNRIKYVGTHIAFDQDMDDVLIDSIKKEQRSNALEDLIERLGFPKDKLQNHKDFKIECYDISNFQGKLAVGSMVVMIDGKSEPNLYRRFRIRMKDEPNDFAMHQEVMSRRFKNFFMQNLTSQTNWETGEEIDVSALKKIQGLKDDESFKIKPDLIIVDGGKGQLASTYKILFNLGLHNEIPIVGLAKREEEIFKLENQFNDEYTFIENSSQFKRILLPRKSESLFLVQRIRDEAHRFAITYHRNLRSKKLLDL